MNEKSGRRVGLRAAARQLGVDVATVRRWLAEGLLCAMPTAGGGVRILQAELDGARLALGFPAQPSSAD